MIERKVEKELSRWIRDGKKALLVDGARQVGKTYSIRRSLESSGSDYLEINLIEKPELIPAIENISSYLVVGGMPEAVQKYVDTGGFSQWVLDHADNDRDVLVEIGDMYLG